MVLVQERDLKIFKWLLEMNYSSLEMLGRLFFADGDSWKKDAVRNRMYQLRSHGWLESVVGLDIDRTTHFAATLKAWHAVQNSAHQGFLPRPRGVHLRTLTHDLAVAWCRIFLRDQIQHWKGERVLKAEIAAHDSDLSRHYVPDAILVDHHWVKWAFELENTQKSERRYRDKIYKYLTLMDKAHPPFDRVVFVLHGPAKYWSLKRAAQNFSRRIIITDYQEIKNGFRL